MLDSAKQVINLLLVDPREHNHPEVKYHLYGMLGKIAEKQNDPKAAAYNFKMALVQSEAQINSLTQVDVIASQIKIEEVQGAFNKKEESYRRERMGLIYGLVITMLIVAVIAMIFNTTRQKRRYEKLFFDSQKKELSFINSHEIRRHLSNILGLVDLIKNSEDKHQQYIEAEDLIMSSAEKLDASIKNISEKLDHEGDF
jgi:tetrahydromethanopterin S-methyltransferase subunit G